jgi:predicted RNA-binding Zn ribbon-like protein
MLALDAIEHQRLRFCALKDCGEAFVAKNQRTRHCSENCSNRDRQQKWQRKQNELLKGATHGSKRPTAKKGR